MWSIRRILEIYTINHFPKGSVSVRRLTFLRDQEVYTFVVHFVVLRILPFIYIVMVFRGVIRGSPNGVSLLLYD